jgi:hypothetical protein
VDLVQASLCRISGTEWRNVLKRLHSMRKTGVLASCVALAGCQMVMPLDPMQLTRFSADDRRETFTFVGKASAGAPIEASAAERTRILGQWLLQTGMCPNGYVILSTRVGPPTSDLIDVFVAGRCK